MNGEFTAAGLEFPPKLVVPAYWNGSVFVGGVMGPLVATASNNLAAGATAILVTGGAGIAIKVSRITIAVDVAAWLQLLSGGSIMDRVRIQASSTLVLSWFPGVRSVTGNQNFVIKNVGAAAVVVDTMVDYYGA